MKEIHHCNFSLFQTKKLMGGYIWNLGRDDEQVSEAISEKCFIYLKTFDNLEDAKIAQKKFKQKTIILTSY